MGFVPSRWDVGLRVRNNLSVNLCTVFFMYKTFCRLISVPLTIWSKSKLTSTLSAAYFRTAKLSQERNSAEETLDDTLESFQLIQNTPKYRHFISQIDSLIPVEFRERLQRRRNRVEQQSVEFVDEKILVKLHKQVKKALQNYHRVEMQWEGQLDYVIYLEDVEKSGRSGGRSFVHSFSSGGSNLWRWWPTGGEQN